MAINGVISRVSILITHIRGLTTPLISTREPPSRLVDRIFSGSEKSYEGQDFKRSGSSTRIERLSNSSVGVWHGFPVTPYLYSTTWHNVQQHIIIIIISHNITQYN